MPQPDQNELLRNSKHFCMIPWVHMHFWPNGNVFPCCIADSSLPTGQYGPQSIEEIWNSPGLRKIRRNMLEDRPSPECKRCYVLEEKSQTYTLRKMSNQEFTKHWDKVVETTPDGSVEKVNVAYLDIRFSNICNFRCRTCGPQLSSSWFEDQFKVFGHPGHSKVVRIEPTDRFWNELKPLLLTVEKSYFAGGEPFLSEEHYRVLDFWIENEKLDVDITYTTNFSKLSFGKRYIVDYWKKFSRVRVSASLDASGNRAEYLRMGTDWNKTIENRKLMMRECPKTDFEITPTISAYNVLHFPDFHEEWLSQGLLGINALRVNLLTAPEEMSIRILPEAMKRRIVKKYQTSMEKIVEEAKRLGQPYGQVESGYCSVIDFIQSKDDTHLIERFLQRVEEIDVVRKQDLFTVFTELKPLSMLWKRQAV